VRLQKSFALRAYLVLHIRRTDFLSLDKSLLGTVALKSRPLQEVLSMGLKDSLR
jgi:hypothetical protein